MAGGGGHGRFWSRSAVGKGTLTEKVEQRWGVSGEVSIREREKLLFVSCAA